MVFPILNRAVTLGVLLSAAGLVMHPILHAAEVTRSAQSAQQLTSPITLKADISEAKVEIITVSGKRPNKRVQDISAQINVISAEDINRLQLYNSDDIANSLANVDMRTASPLNSSISIRGVGARNWHINANQGVQLALDDSNILGAYGSKLMLFDIQRAEVYRGPQNGLFGINSSGGAIYYESVKPQVDDDSGFAHLQLGNDGFNTLQGAINIPINQQIAARVALYQQQRDPLWHNLLNDTQMGSIDHQGVRLHALWQINPTDSLLFTYQRGKDDSSRTPFLSMGYWDSQGSNVINNQIQDINAPVDCPNLLPSSSAAYNRAHNCVTLLPFSGNQATANGAGNWYQTYDNAGDVSFVTFDNVKLHYQAQYDWGKLTSISAYDTVDSGYMETLNNLPQGLAFMPAQMNEKRQLTQEVRLSNSHPDTGIEWLVGGYYSYAEDFFGTVITRADQAGAPFGIVPSVAIEQTAIVRSLFGLYEQQFAKQWIISGTLRYSYENKYGVSTARVLAKTDDGTPAGNPLGLSTYIDRALLEQLTANPSGICPPSIGGFPCQLDTPVSQNSYLTGGNISIGYLLQPNQQVYAQYARGFLSGAFDTRALAAFVGTADDPVQPEVLDAAEIGYKGEWQDFTVNGAIFKYFWRDKQTFDVNNDGNPAFLNIPESQLIGADLTVDWQLNSQWHINAGIGLLSSEVTDSGNLRFTQIGKSLSYIPDWSSTLNLNYQWQWGGGESSVTLAWRYRDDVYSRIQNDPFNRIEAQQFVDINWQHQFMLDQAAQWQVEAGVKNLTDEKVCQALTNNNALSYNVQCIPNTGKAQWYVGTRVDF